MEVTGETNQLSELKQSWKMGLVVERTQDTCLSVPVFCFSLASPYPAGHLALGKNSKPLCFPAEGVRHFHGHLFLS